MAIYAGETECKVIYVTKGGAARRVSSVWVGDKQVFPPANRQEIHVFNRDTQGYQRVDRLEDYGFAVPMPWWATAVDVVMIGAGEKGQDGTKSFSGGSDGAGGRAGAWVVKTVAVPNAPGAYITIGKGISTSPHYTEVIFPNTDGTEVRVWDGEGVRTPNSGSTGGSVTPASRFESGQTHTGGYGGGLNSPGTHPGGGGGGGKGSNLLGNPTPGQNGGDGYVWLRFRSATGINPGDAEFVLRVGVTSGDAFAPLRDWAVGIGKTYQTITEITAPMEVVGPSLQWLFSGCQALTSVPDMDTSQVTDMGYLFYGCSSLASIPDLDTGQVVDMRYMFSDCSSLAGVPTLSASRVADVGYMFFGCSSLESVTLPGMGAGFTSSQVLDMRDTMLRREAAEDLLRSLGTVPTAASGSVVKLPASAAGVDGGIAMDKNWEVTTG